MILRVSWVLVALVVACGGSSDGNGGTGGVGGAGGQGGSGGSDVVCVDSVCSCDEAGIRAAVAEGGGPFAFDCDGPTSVVTDAEIAIDRDVILDSEGSLTVDGNEAHRVFSVATDITAELRRFTVGGGNTEFGGGIFNQGNLTLTNSTVSGNTAGADGGGIFNQGNLTLTNSTVSGNAAGSVGGGIHLGGGTVTLTNSTVSGNAAEVGGDIHVDSGTVTLTNSLVEGDCAMTFLGLIASNGYNIESPSDTCGLNDPTDQANVSTDDLKLGPLQDNGGPTMTHALLPSSLAIDVIPEADCVDADGEPLTTDQRGESRDSMCDVGAFEVQP